MTGGGFGREYVFDEESVFEEWVFGRSCVDWAGMLIFEKGGAFRGGGGGGFGGDEKSMVERKE